MSSRPHREWDGSIPQKQTGYNGKNDQHQSNAAKFSDRPHWKLDCVCGVWSLPMYRGIGNDNLFRVSGQL
jgi:hypothetical protein